MVLAKDFVETAEGLIFAIVESELEQGKALCFLRYIITETDGVNWQKVNTVEANQFLADYYPQYLYFSENKQAYCHALTLEQIYKHFRPKNRLKQLLTADQLDSVEQDCVSLCLFFQQHGLDLEQVGVTGSILISAQKQSSDIDLVFYSREVFNQARQITRQLIIEGYCSQLADNHWLESYDRRSCDLSYDDYVWHEKRKFNKAVINQRKFDLTLVNLSVRSDHPISYKKIQPIVLKAQVVDDSLSFDYPAEFVIQHPEINSIVCYTATYTGQAKTGEWVEVSGVVERASDGQRRVVVGSNREAAGEYIKVCYERTA